MGRLQPSSRHSAEQPVVRALAGRHFNRPLQEAWNTHGETVFIFEALDRLAPDLSSMAQGTALKESLALWRDELKAAPLI